MTTPITSCVVCTVPRSGSWLLADGLANTGVCGRPEEFFRRDYLDDFLVRRGYSVLAAYEEFLAEVVDEGTTPNGVFSVKVHWQQFVPLLVALRLGSPGAVTDAELLETAFPVPAYVRLIREDKERAAVSYFRAIRTASWWSTEDGMTERVSAKDVLPNYDRIWWLEQILREHDLAWDRFFEANELEPLVLTYESLCSDYEGAVRSVLDYVGVPQPVRLRPPRLVKQADATSERWLEGYLAWLEEPVAEAVT